MAQLSAAETTLAADRTIHDVGSTWMIDDGTRVYGEKLGYAEPLTFYFAGRGGVLGEVDYSVVSAAMGWWEPGVVRTKWDKGIAVAGRGEGDKQPEYGLRAGGVVFAPRANA